MANEDMSRKRDASLDLIKFVSCIFIVILHSPAIAQGSVFVIIRSITSVAVPAFMAVTGYLILYSKQRDYKDVIKRSFLRYVVLFLVWWIVYVGFNYRMSEQSISIFRYGVQNAEGWHLWYLYVYLKILLIYPFVRLITNNRKLSLAFSLIWLVLVPVRFSVGSLLQIDDIFLRWLNLPGFQYDGYIGGTLMGYYPSECLGMFIGGGFLIDTLKERNTRVRSTCLLIGLTGLISTVLGTIFIVKTVGDNYFDFGLQPLQLNVVMATTGYIAVCLWISETIQRTRFSNFYTHTVEALSKKTLGVYCIHILILRLMRNVIGGGTDKLDHLSFYNLPQLRNSKHSLCCATCQDS